MKKFDATIKTDKAENWAKAINYIPEKGTIIVYEYANGSQKIKLGNGSTLLANLPFLTDSSDGKNTPFVDQDTLTL